METKSKIWMWVVITIIVLILAFFLVKQSGNPGQTDDSGTGSGTDNAGETVDDTNLETPDDIIGEVDNAIDVLD